MQINEQDLSAIRAVAQAYVEGMVFCNEAKLRQAFHPSASIVGNYQGQLEWLSLDAFISAVLAETPAPAGTQPEWSIQSASQEGDAATVEVADTWLGMRFTDFLSLLNIEGRWQIVHKLYYIHP